MGLSGEKAQNRQADTLLASSTAAVDKAATEDPATKEMRDYWKSIVDWDTGKSGPIDVNKLPGSQVDIDLFTKAKAMKDAGRVGRGFGTAGDNVNPAFTAALDKEMELQRSEDASAGLENVVEGKVADARAGLTGIGSAATAQALNAAGLRRDLYSTYLNRPRNKGLLDYIIPGAVSAAGQLGQGALQAGGWGGLFAM